jgi:hypothetical protein
LPLYILFDIKEFLSLKYEYMERNIAENYAKELSSITDISIVKLVSSVKNDIILKIMNWIFHANVCYPCTVAGFFIESLPYVSVIAVFATHAYLLTVYFLTESSIHLALNGAVFFVVALIQYTLNPDHVHLFTGTIYANIFFLYDLAYYKKCLVTAVNYWNVAIWNAIMVPFLRERISFFDVWYNDNLRASFEVVKTCKTFTSMALFREPANYSFQDFMGNAVAVVEPIDPTTTASFSGFVQNIPTHKHA